MTHHTFSIIVPVYSEPEGSNHYRYKTTQRLIDSIVNQTYPHWELILVDDGAKDFQTPQLLDDWAAKDSRIKVIHQENQQRAIARNNGMRGSKHDWLIWADCDDMFTRDALWTINICLNQYPERQVFFFGALIRYPTGFYIRHVFEPMEEGDGMEWFKAGAINTGSFVWHRSLMEDPANWIPDQVNPYQFAADSGFDMRLPATFTEVENPTGAFSDHVYRHGYSLGNPWGDDALQAYKLTRHHKVQAIDIAIYIIFPRGYDDQPDVTEDLL